MGNIKRELFSGVFYIAVAKYSGILIQLVITAILARLLTPADFGVVAIATVIIAFFNILSDIGIGPAIIQNRELTSNDLEHIFSFTVYVGIVLAVVFFLCAWPIAGYYNNKILVSVCQWLSIPIFFYCINIVPLNLQYKYKRFKFTAFTALTAQTIAGIFSVIGAYSGMGLHALIISPIISSVILFGVYYWHERFHFFMKIKMKSLKKIMSFSLYQFLFNLINYFSRNLDKLLIGRFIGMSPLGYYEKSYRLMLLPLQNITFVVTPVMQPIFSSFQNNLYDLAEKYKKVLHLLAYISFPLSALFYFTARELILIFFGNQWGEAIGIFQILALTVSMQILTSTAGSIYQSANATKQLFVSGCWCTFFMIVSFCVTIFFWGTIEAVAYGFLIAQMANTVQCFYLLFRTLRYPIIAILRMLLRPFVIGSLLFFFLYVLGHFLPIENMFVSLFVKSIFSLVISLSLIQLLGGYDILNYVRTKFNFIKR
ncbi:lipopolysaccharide biosynthesis protein [Bacteroides cellulosilyticus]|uniref:lipopolysaccharide biosynthesis protein n=1 Tax=Bacteroides cellulosilyticus TaxID=246787 RepID=UPI00189D7434|nr:lipopolysaccharide biosynthesis protein [Bacteroides cellulosilyticus]